MIVIVVVVGLAEIDLAAVDVDVVDVVRVVG